MKCGQIRVCDRQADVDILQLQELFNLAAFWAQNRSLADWEVAIANSDPVISIWDDDRLIGFTRANSDCVFRATIWDVVVHPDYRGQGLGRKLIETLLDHPRIRPVERVYLMTTYQQEFYLKLGFEFPNPSTAMVLYNQRRINAASARAIEQMFEKTF
ncbi:GNAT family N-acetyltransferase [Aerosakkonemataceae cyanobacterium BLCC-F154]|uniref:GNAT family N-acetyltransferase n=1 Tax=Floridaenema fluviatile BLCC-F154 TaxID=3153640 RepID=A0ABV4Y6E3_9CYAN